MAIGKIVQAKMDQKAAEKQARDAARFRREALDLARSQHWDPELVSDVAQPYQRAQSPIARSFLESLLTGSNPAAISSTRLGASRLKAGAQQAFDQRFGGWDKLYDQQRQIEQEKPWELGEIGRGPRSVGPLTQSGEKMGAPGWGAVSTGGPWGEFVERAGAAAEAAGPSDMQKLQQEIDAGNLPWLGGSGTRKANARWAGG